jgi:N4-gp56 family major capsid protein
MGETMDQIDRDNLNAGATTAVYANGSSVVTVTEILDKNDIDRTHRTLKANKAVEYVPMIEASEKVGTMPIMPSYWGLCHEDTAFDLRHTDGFALSAEYGQSTGRLEGEFGASKNGIRWLASPNGYRTLGATGVTAAGTNVKNTASFVDVYSTFVCGKNAMMGVDLANGNGGVVRAGYDDQVTVADPLKLRRTTGWKKYYVSKVCNSAFLVQLYSCASL